MGRKVAKRSSSESFLSDFRSALGGSRGSAFFTEVYGAIAPSKPVVFVLIHFGVSLRKFYAIRGWWGKLTGTIGFLLHDIGNKITSKLIQDGPNSVLYLFIAYAGVEICNCNQLR